MTLMVQLLMMIMMAVVVIVLMVMANMTIALMMVLTCQMLQLGNVQEEELNCRDYCYHRYFLCFLFFLKFLSTRAFQCQEKKI